MFVVAPESIRIGLSITLLQSARLRRAAIAAPRCRHTSRGVGSLMGVGAMVAREIRSVGRRVLNFIGKALRAMLRNRIGPRKALDGVSSALRALIRGRFAVERCTYPMSIQGRSRVCLGQLEVGLDLI